MGFWEASLLVLGVSLKPVTFLSILVMALSRRP